MNTDLDDIAVKDNEAEQRYEAEIDGELAVIEYERSGDTIVFLHTEVPEALEGRGLASKMAHAALEDARAHRLEVVPLCPYVASYIKRHPEYRALVPTQFQHRVDGDGG